MRYPPSEFPPGSDHWQARMTCADFQRVARTADELGFDALTVSEHLALPVDLVPNMGAWWPHAFTAMAFLAGASTRIKVNASVIVLPYHHPVAFAKAKFD
jgi:alkanesulfonate monooxygenase SsuD/methylene tetrahydromethanopterin reductase-like flavin-dependent oxidoreductase (luciferase family)